MYNNMCEYDIQFEAGTTQFFRFNLFDIYGVPLYLKGEEEKLIKIQKIIFRMARLGSSESVLDINDDRLIKMPNDIKWDNNIPYIVYELNEQTKNLCGLYEYQCYLIDEDDKKYSLEDKKIAYITKMIR